jgi:hypothetical protein
MPRGKQFDVCEKTTIMKLFTEGVAPNEIAMWLKRNAAAFCKVIAANRNLPLFTSPPPPKKRNGSPRKMTPKREERLRKFLLRYPFKTAKKVKKEQPGSVRLIQKTCQTRLKMPPRATAKKPLLTAAKVKKQIVFCKKTPPLDRR